MKLTTAQIGRARFRGGVVNVWAVPHEQVIHPVNLASQMSVKGPFKPAANRSGAATLGNRGRSAERQFSFYPPTHISFPRSCSVGKCG